MISLSADRRPWPSARSWPCSRPLWGSAPSCWSVPRPTRTRPPRCGPPAAPCRLSPMRDGRLRVTANDAAGRWRADPDTLRVLVSVVDDQKPKVDETARAAVTVLAMSPGTATAEQLARVAVSAAADGRQLAGIIVADPGVGRPDHRPAAPAGPARRRRPPTRCLRHDDGDPTVRDKDREVLPSMNGDADLPERLWLYDDFAARRGRSGHRLRGRPGQPGLHRRRLRRAGPALVRHRPGRPGAGLAYSWSPRPPTRPRPRCC